MGISGDKLCEFQGTCGSSVVEMGALFRGLDGEEEVGLLEGGLDWNSWFEVGDTSVSGDATSFGEGAWLPLLKLGSVSVVLDTIFLPRDFSFARLTGNDERDSRL